MNISSQENTRGIALLLAVVFFMSMLIPAVFSFPSFILGKTIPALLVALFWAVLNTGFGAGLYGLFRNEKKLEPDWIIGFALGLGLNGILIYIIALLSVLNVWSLAVLIAVNFAVGFSSLLQLFKILMQGYDTFNFKLELSERIAGYAALIFLGFILVMSSIPPTIYDSMDNHLALVQQYWIAGAITNLPEHFMSYYPRLHEFLLMVPYAVYGAESANVFTALIAIAAILVAAKVAKQAGGSYPVTTSLLLAVPLIGYLAIDVKNDMTLGFFELVFVYLVFDDKRRVKEKIILSAFVLGFACDTKYSALAMFPGFLLAAFYFVKPRLKDPQIVSVLAKSVGIFIMLLFPFYLLTFIQKGSPVYPAFPAVFGNDPNIDYQVLNSEIQSVSSLKEIPLFFYNLFFNPFSIDGDNAVIGFAVLFLLPFLYFLKKADKKIIISFLIIWLWCLVPVFTITTKIRFFPLFFIIPAILMGIAFKNLPHKAWNKLGAAILLAGLVHSFALQIQLSQIFYPDSFNLISDKIDYQKYLRQSLSYYKLKPHIEINSKKDEIVLMEGEHRFAYIDRQIRIASPYEVSYLEKLYKAGLSADDIILKLKQDNIGLICIVFMDHLGKPAINYPLGFIEKLAKRNKIINFDDNSLVVKIL